MNMFASKDLPKDARWQDLITQLKCPQCQMHQASSISSLEKHVILHCKCRSPLMKTFYIRRFKTMASEANEDVMDCVRLMLEAKLLQWRKEGMPEIPLLLRQPEAKPHQEQYGKNKSTLLDLWRLWQQELDSTTIEYSAAELLHLTSEAESIEWDPLRDDPLPPLQHRDDQLNLELIAKVTETLKDMQNKFKLQGIEGYSQQQVDPDTVERLEREAYILSCMSQ